jgi:hypothetical protein
VLAFGEWVRAHLDEFNAARERFDRQSAVAGQNRGRAAAAD